MERSLIWAAFVFIFNTNYFPICSSGATKESSFRRFFGYESFSLSLFSFFENVYIIVDKADFHSDQVREITRCTCNLKRRYFIFKYENKKKKYQSGHLLLNYMRF
jgi:hypothetical protein